jgi:hypothetical protein
MPELWREHFHWDVIYCRCHYGGAFGCLELCVIEDLAPEVTI